MKNHSKKSFIRWTPHWSILNANDEITSITWSCHQIDIYLKGKLWKTLAIDAGMFNGSRNVLANNHIQFPQGVIDADGFILTHTHNDHVWRLPKLVGEGYNRDIILSSDAYGVFEPIMEDTFNIQLWEYEIDQKRRKQLGSRLNKALSGGDKKMLEKYNISKNSDIWDYLDRVYPKTPLFTEDDLQRTLAALRPLWYSTKRFNEAVTLFGDKEGWDKLDLRLLDAAHVFGSSMSLLELQREKSNKLFNILRSGDVGRLWNKIHGKNPSMSGIIKPLDLLFMESTYGGRNHPNIHNEIERLYGAINETFKRWWPVVCPTFTQTRFQDMIVLLSGWIDTQLIPENTMIVADSRLAHDIAKWMIMRRPHTYNGIVNNPKIRRIDNPQDTVDMLKTSYNKNIIFVLSGWMIQWWSIMKVIHYLNKKKPIKWSERLADQGSIVLSGYTPPYTLWSKIKEDKDSYNSISVNFSSHIDHEWIINFITNRDGESGIKMRKNGKVVLMHGEIGGMYKIKDDLVNNGLLEENIIIPVKNWESIDFSI